MIPKIIHLCWFSGDPYPRVIQKCLDSWKKNLPDYEVKLWDANSFDFDSVPWTKEAFQQKKWAFVADYIRFYAVYNYGGIYLDSDVEVLKSFDDLLGLPYFIGEEAFPDLPEIAVFGAEKGTPWVGECMSFYHNRHFIKDDGSFDIEACPHYMLDVLKNRYRLSYISSLSDYDYSPETMNIFPNYWFNAHHAEDNSIFIKKYDVREQTYSVHHFTNTWLSFKRGPIHRILAKLLRVEPHHLGRKFHFFS